MNKQNRRKCDRKIKKKQLAAKDTAASYKMTKKINLKNVVQLNFFVYLQRILKVKQLKKNTKQNGNNSN